MDSKDQILDLKLKALGITDDVMREFIEQENLALIVNLETQQIVYSTPLTDLAFGYIEGELQGKFLNDLIPERFRGVHDSHYKGYSNNPERRQMGGDTNKKLIGLKKDGSEFELEIWLNAKAKAGVRFAIARIMLKRNETPK